MSELADLSQDAQSAFQKFVTRNEKPRLKVAHELETAGLVRFDPSKGRLALTEKGERCLQRLA